MVKVGGRLVVITIEMVTLAVPETRPLATMVTGPTLSEVGSLKCLVPVVVCKRSAATSSAFFVFSMRLSV